MADINVGAISEALNNKMDLDGNNVIASAGASFRNTSNWSNNMTNCITYIPQDINLELNNGTLALKAGSKVYVPNGAGVFDTVAIESDLTRTTFGSETTSLLYYIPSTNTLTYEKVSMSSSGASHTPTVYSVWYDTTNNVINRYTDDSSIPSSTVSLPIAIIKTSSSAITSIDQVFNGFGYIGSTVFALPGVKSLIPNGRNEDGTLNNTEITISNVITQTNISPSLTLDFVVRQDGISGGISLLSWNYNEAENQIYNSIGTKASWIPVARFFADSNYRITTFTPKQVFHSVDYSDFKPVQDHRVIEFQVPTAANDYTWYRKYADGWVEQGGTLPNTSGWANHTVTLPITMSNNYYFTVPEGVWTSGDSLGNLVLSKTTTQIQFHYYSKAASGYTTWEAKGMAA